MASDLDVNLNTLFSYFSICDTCTPTFTCTPLHVYAPPPTGRYRWTLLSQSQRVWQHIKCLLWILKSQSSDKKAGICLCSIKNENESSATFADLLLLFLFVIVLGFSILKVHGATRVDVEDDEDGNDSDMKITPLQVKRMYKNKGINPDIILINKIPITRYVYIL